MAVCTRRLLALVVAGLGLQASGCDLGSMMYFLMEDPRAPATMKALASKDEKKVPRVAILTWAGLETRSEFIHADRQLSDLLAAQLRDLAEGNQEKLTIVPPRKIEEYKNLHPNWREKDLAEIGRRLDADYLIYLEINSMSLYEPGGNHLFRGRANLTVNLVDVRHPDDAPAQAPFSCLYPSDAKGPIPADFDSNPVEFRQAFLKHMAKQLSYYFSRYPKRESYFTE
jgi:hypothetical protein